MRTILAGYQVRIVERDDIELPMVTPESEYTYGWGCWVLGMMCPSGDAAQRGWSDAKYAEESGRDVRWSR